MRIFKGKKKAAPLKIDVVPTDNMEGIPRVLMIVPDLKVPEPPSLTSQCQKIKNNDPSHFHSAFAELDELRSSILIETNEQTLILTLKRYYAQLAMMKNRFPMETDGEASIEFAWQDRSSDGLPVAIPDINFELCCVMFDIGTLHASIAGAQSRTEEDSIKVAFDHFRAASWPFKYLRDELKADRLHILDFSNEVLTFFTNVMLAQAQECLLEKSLVNHNSSLVSAKIALKLSEIYEKCGLLVEREMDTNRDAFSLLKMTNSRAKSLISLCQIKSHLYSAMGHFFRGLHCDENLKQFGKGLACYAYGLERAKSAVALSEKEKREGLRQPPWFVLEVLTQKEANSRRENDFIYHERIPPLSELDPVGSIDLVSPQGYDPVDKSVAGEDLFKELLPANVVTTVSVYEETKAQLKRKVLDDCEKKDSSLDDFLLTLQLDKLNLDQPADAYRLPDVLLSCCSEISAKPTAIPDLHVKFHEVTIHASDAECQLSELNQRLAAITSKELTSDEGYKVISKKVKDLLEHHQTAKKNNVDLQNAFETHQDNLKMLSIPMNELSVFICGDIVDAGSTPEGQELRRLLDKVDEMRRQRCKLVNDLREALEGDDITAQALANPFADSNQLSAKQIKRHDALVDLIDKNLSAQDNILKAVINANAEFAEVRSKLMEAHEKKSNKAVTLCTAFQVYKEVVEKTNKAIDFYSQLFKLVSTLSQSIKNIEEINAEAEKKVLEKKRLQEERERAAKAAKEAAEAMADFGFSSGPVSRSYQVTPQLTPGLPKDRPRLSDFMPSYQSKRAQMQAGSQPNWTPASMPHPVGPTPQQQQQPSQPHNPGYPNSNPAFPSQAQPTGFESAPPYANYHPQAAFGNPPTSQPVSNYSAPYQTPRPYRPAAMTAQQYSSEAMQYAVNSTQPSAPNPQLYTPPTQPTPTPHDAPPPNLPQAQSTGQFQPPSPFQPLNGQAALARNPPPQPLPTAFQPQPNAAQRPQPDPAQPPPPSAYQPATQLTPASYYPPPNQAQPAFGYGAPQQAQQVSPWHQGLRPPQYPPAAFAGTQHPPTAPTQAQQSTSYHQPGQSLI